MKILRPILILLVAVIAGLALGRLIRSRQEPAQELQTFDHSSPAASSKLVPLERAVLDETLPGKLERELAIANDVARRLLWMEAVEKAALPDFPRLARMALSDPSALHLVALRWIELDPADLFRALASGTLAGTPAAGRFLEIFELDWPEKSEAGIIAALSDGPAFGQRDRFRETVIRKIVKSDPELVLELTARWQIENDSFSMDSLAEWAAADPRHAAEFAIAHQAGRVTRSALEAIGKEWGRIDPVAALRFATAKRGDDGVILARAVLGAWSKGDLKAAGQWLDSVNQSTRDRLAAPFVEAWAREDAAAALMWSESHLSGSAFNRAAASVFTGAVENDLPAAARLVLAMEPSAARAQGAAVIGEKWLPHWSDQKRKASPEAIAWVDQLDPGSVASVLERVHSTWVESDPDTFLSVLDRHHTRSIPVAVYDSVARSLVRKDPERALTWAETIPDEYRLTVGSEAFRHWYHSQPEFARAWLRQLPPNDPRHHSFQGRLIREFVFDQRAESHLASLPPEDRAAAVPVIEKMSLPEPTKTKLLQAARAQ